jgi:Protein of unknown function (DUF2442)
MTLRKECNVKCAAIMSLWKATPLSGYRARLVFENGDEKIVALLKHLNGPIFKPVRSLRMFRRMRVGECGGLEWPNGADLCPDVLYYGGPPPWASA